MLSAEKVSIFDGKGTFFRNFEQVARSWMRFTKMAPPSRAAALAVHMNSVARQVCPPAGGDRLGNTEDASRAGNFAE